jgi:hypothetical protein
MKNTSRTLNGLLLSLGLLLLEGGVAGGGAS